MIYKTLVNHLLTKIKSFVNQYAQTVKKKIKHPIINTDDVLLAYSLRI